MIHTKHLAASLVSERNKLETVVFDPSDPTHMSAYRMLIKEGKQHHTIRFKLEHPFFNIRSMLMSKVSDAYLNSFSRTE